MYLRRSLVILAGVLSFCAAAVPGSQAREPLMEIGMPTNEGSDSESAEGMEGYLTLQVDIEAGITKYLAAIADRFRKVLRRERIGYAGLHVLRDRIIFEVQEPTQSAKAAQLLERSWPGLALSRRDAYFEVFFAQDELVGIRRDILHQTLNSVRAHTLARGIDVDGIRAQGQRCILVSRPAADKLRRIMRSSNSTRRLTFRSIDTNVDPDQGKVPPGFDVLELRKDIKGRETVRYVVDRRFILHGGQVVETAIAMENGRSIVIVRFDVLGRHDSRQRLSGTARLLAIVLDDKVIATARLQRYPPDRVALHGDFTAEQAKHLAIVLSASSYPAPIKIVDTCVE